MLTSTTLFLACLALLALAIVINPLRRSN